MTVRVPWTEMEFLEKAVECKHPFDRLPSIDPVVAENIRSYLQLGGAAIVKFRLYQCSRISALAKEVHEENVALLAACHPDVQHILAGKNMVLFDRLLKEISHPDKTLITELLAGAYLIGDHPVSNIFATKVPDMRISETDLRRAGKWVKPKIVGSCRSSGNLEVDRAAWKETLEERDAGWLAGPFVSGELDVKFPEGWLPAKRFPLQQGEKLRLIDDYTAPHTNKAFSASEKISLDNVDEIASVVKYFMMQAKDSGLSLRGRTLDLKAAYRQLAVSPRDAWIAVVCVWDPVRCVPCFFTQRAMPFGACASVYVFNRLAKAVWALGTKLLKLVWCNYFDDYPMIEAHNTCASAWSSAETLLAKLGYAISMAPEKRLPFSRVFGALGVLFDLSRASEGVCEVRNKPSRIEALGKINQEVLAADNLTPHEAEEIRGKYLYASTQLFGKAAAAALYVVGRRACQSGGSFSLSEQLKRALGDLLLFVKHSPPRLIPMPGGRPVVIFTDGACEPKPGGGLLATCGAVLVVGGICREFFGIKIPVEFVSEWTTTGHKQVVGQAELLPILIARRMWKRHLVGQKTLIFIDNDAAREGAVKGYSPSDFSRHIIQAISHEETLLPCWPWFARVASCANIADGPSRLKFLNMIRLGAVQREVEDGHMSYSQRDC